MDKCEELQHFQRDVTRKHVEETDPRYWNDSLVCFLAVKTLLFYCHSKLNNIPVHIYKIFLIDI